MSDQKNNKPTIYYPGMDNLRGIAVLLVIFYHNFSVISFSMFGFLGVDLFFVISGFLITDLLLRQKESNNFIRNFYARRILRIFPVYYLTLIFLIFILPLFYNVPYNLQYYRDHQKWFYLFLQNWLFVLRPLENKFLLNHFWSLAVEEQFYLTWPIIIFYTQRINRLLYAITGIFLVVFITRALLLYANTKVNPITAFTFFRFDGLLTGSALAIFIHQGFALTKKILNVILIPLVFINAGFFIAVYIFHRNLPYFPYCGFTTFSILFGLVAWQMVKNKNNEIKKTTGSGVLQFFGRISYGLYIFHWPIFILLFPSMQTTVSHYLKSSPFTTDIYAAALTTITAILLSILSRQYFEQFFLNFKKRFS